MFAAAEHYFAENEAVVTPVESNESCGLEDTHG